MTAPKTSDKRRPLLKLAIGVLGALCITLVAMASYYASIAMRRPTIAVDYVARINEQALSVPEEDRAWPVYLRAIEALRPITDDQSKVLADLDTQSPEWQQAVTALRSTGAIPLLHEASTRPHVGFVLGIESENQLLVAQGYEPEHAHTPTSTFLFDARLVYLGTILKFARYLAADSIGLPGEHNGDIAANNTKAILGFARHGISSNDSFISWALGINVTSLACEQIAQAASRDYDTLNDTCISDITDALNELRQHTGRVKYAYEMQMFHDTLQRIYTDDGRGNGNIVPLEAFDTLAKLTEQASDVPDGVYTFALLYSPFALSRRESTALIDEVWREIEAESAVPFWERTDYPRYVDLVKNGINLGRDRPIDLAARILAKFIPPASRLTTVGQACTQHIDATISLLALLTIRQQTGNWPESLPAIQSDTGQDATLDRYSGRTLLYRLTEAGPLLYSVGMDGDDDFGRHAPKAREWNHPASRARQLAEAPADYDGDWVFFPPPPDDRDED